MEVDKVIGYVLGDFELMHYSVHRGGCLHTGEIVIRNKKIGLTRYINSTMEACKTPGMKKYYDALIKKQIEIEGN